MNESAHCLRQMWQSVPECHPPTRQNPVAEVQLCNCLYCPSQPHSAAPCSQSQEFVIHPPEPSSRFRDTAERAPAIPRGGDRISSWSLCKSNCAQTLIVILFRA